MEITVQEILEYCKITHDFKNTELVIAEVPNEDGAKLTVVCTKGSVPSLFKITDKKGLVFYKDRHGNNVRFTEEMTWRILCVLFSTDLNENGNISKEGANNGCLVIGGKTITYDKFREIIK